MEITASYPAGVIGSTADNLKAAAAGEKMEWGTLYPNFADVAQKEGFLRSQQRLGWLGKWRPIMNAATTNWLKACSEESLQERPAD